MFTPWRALVVASFIVTVFVAQLISLRVNSRRVHLAKDESHRVVEVQEGPLIIDQAYITLANNFSVTALANFIASCTGRKQEPYRWMLYVNSSRPFWICEVPKCGTTVWSSFWLFVNEGVDMFRMDGTTSFSHQPGIRVAKNMTEPSLFNEFVHRERLVIVRNPYTRFLSSYLDWMARNHQPENVSFEEFALRYEHNDMKGYVYLPSHVRPAAQVCQIHLYAMTGFLRVEQMDLWFNAFMQRFGLDRFVDALSAKDKMFYKATLTNGTRVADAMLEVFGKIPWKGTSAKTGHVRDAGAHLAEYYTPQLAQKVFDLQRDDFEHFGYPAWDGDPSTFRFV